MHARMIGLALASLASAATLTACGSSDGSGSAAQSPLGSATQAAATTASTESSGPDGLESNGLRAEGSDATPIATRTATYDESKVRIDVLSLRRDGELSTLQLRLTNVGPKEYSVNHDFGDATNYDLSAITLLDGKNSKRYLVGRDSRDRCVCSSTSGLRIEPDASYTVTATFAAPPASVTTIGLSIPGLGILNDVPVS